QRAQRVLDQRVAKPGVGDGAGPERDGGLGRGHGADDPTPDRGRAPRAERRGRCAKIADVRYHLTTFGCQMNEHDSERMKGLLESIGYAEAPSRDDADLILFNTCTIRGSADERFLGNLGDAKRIKRERPDAVVAV